MKPSPAIEYHELGSGHARSLLELWPRPGAGTLLFYAGTMLSPLQYRTFLTAVYNSGLAVAAVHFRGHGYNKHHSRFTFADLLEDAQRAEAWLHRHTDGPLVLCGHSQGGILTLAHASRTASARLAFPITGVLPQEDVAVDLTLFRRYRRHKAQLLRAICGAAACLPRLPLPVFSYLSLVRIRAGAQNIKASSRKSRSTYPLAFLASLFTARIDPAMRCPVYFFSARDDALFTPALIQATMASLEAPRKKVLWLEKGGHLAVMDPQICTRMAKEIAALCAAHSVPLHCGS